MDVVGLKDATQVGPVRLALAQALDCCLFVAERFEKSIRKFRGVERALR